jgi:uncharacterized C2H2 Zn-finger protein
METHILLHGVDVDTVWPCRRRFLAQEALVFGDLLREEEATSAGLSRGQTIVAAHQRWTESWANCGHIMCSFCGEEFNSARDYNEHTLTLHSHSCATCGRDFLTEHWLILHAQEQHDSFFQVLASRQPMYACFVPSCSVKFQTAQDRREHAAKEHGFPARLGLAIAKRRARSAHAVRASEEAVAAARERRARKAAAEASRRGPTASHGDLKGRVVCRHFASAVGCKRGEACRFLHEKIPSSAGMEDDELDSGRSNEVAQLTEAMSTLTTNVPMHISFGRGRGRGYARIGRR